MRLICVNLGQCKVGGGGDTSGQRGMSCPTWEAGGMNLNDAELLGINLIHFTSEFSLGVVLVTSRIVFIGVCSPAWV